MLCQKADAVIVCSEQLYQMKLPLAKDKLTLIPNGVDIEHYQVVLSGSGPLPPNAAKWPRRVFGYTGRFTPTGSTCTWSRRSPPVSMPG